MVKMVKMEQLVLKDKKDLMEILDQQEHHVPIEVY
jgi:hypothetical protein